MGRPMQKDLLSCWEHSRDTDDVFSMLTAECGNGSKECRESM